MAKQPNNHTILVVEDEAALNQAVCDVLTQEGYTVTSSPNGKEGLQAAQDQHPELIICDIMMPLMDGLTMVKELRNIQTDPKSKVIFFTNLSEVDKIADALKEGAEGYIVKSQASLDEVLLKINTFFEKK